MLFHALLLVAAAPGGVAPVSYPSTARLELDARSRSLCNAEQLEVEGVVPPSTCGVRVGQQVATALSAAVSQMFSPSPAEPFSPDLSIFVDALKAQVARDMGRPSAELSARVVVRAGLRQLAEVTIRGSEPLVAPGAEAAQNTFARAAADLARDFRSSLVNEPNVVRFLLGKGVTPQESSILGPPRGDVVLFADASPGFLFGPGIGLALEGRLGLETRWFFLRGALRSVTILDSGGDATAVSSLSAEGLEVGPLFRFHRDWEVRAGVGLQFASGDVSQAGAPDAQFSRTLPSIVAGVQYSLPTRTSATRVHFAFDLRTEFDDRAPIDALRRVVIVGGTSALLTVGVEFTVWPLNSAPLAPSVGAH